MKPSKIKLELIQKIAKIHDADILKKIQSIIKDYETLNNSASQEPFSKDRSTIHSEKEDFTDYIKEWVKDL